MNYDYYKAYRDGELISEGNMPVPEEVEQQAHELHWFMEAQLFGSPETA